MFDNIFAAIEKWMRELLTGMVESNMSTMFTDVNEKTSEIAAQVGRTPQNWNSSVFSMIQNLSESVVVPIAGIIITLVLCYELISMLTERNNLHDVDPPLMEKPMNQKPSLHQMEHYQKFYENGEYVRAVESTTEQNYNMIDGCANNLPKPRIINGRESVLDKLRIRQMAREKQKSSQEQSADMERNRK